MDSTNDFYRDLALSQTERINNKIKTELERRFPNSQAIQNLTNEDDGGIDWQVLGSVFPINIDIKIRDWSKSKSEDIVLELMSNVETGKVGWAEDPSKLTHYVLWYWKGDGAFYMTSFKNILDAVSAKKEEWVKKYGRTQYTRADYGGYHSTSIFVPIKEYEAVAL